MEKLAFPRSPKSVPFDEPKALLRSHVIPLNLKPTERATFHSLFYGRNMRLREFIPTHHAQASRCKFRNRMEIHLRDSLILDVNRLNIQKKLLFKQDLAFAEARVVFKQSDDVSNATVENSVFHSRRNQSRQSGNPYR